MFLNIPNRRPKVCSATDLLFPSAELMQQIPSFFAVLVSICSIPEPNLAINLSFFAFCKNSSSISRRFLTIRPSKFSIILIASDLSMSNAFFSINELFSSNSISRLSTLSVIKIFLIYPINSAIEKYINNPITSFIVVINGPVANAGSTLLLFNIIGIKVPKSDANSITVTKETLTIIPILICEYNKKHTIKTIELQMIPFIRATPTSFTNLLVQCCTLNFYWQLLVQ